MESRPWTIGSAALWSPGRAASPQLPLQGKGAHPSSLGPGPRCTSPRLWEGQVKSRWGGWGQALPRMGRAWGKGLRSGPARPPLDVPSLQGPPGKGCAWLTPQSSLRARERVSRGQFSPPSHSILPLVPRGLPTMPLAPCSPALPTPFCSPLSGERMATCPAPRPAPNGLFRKTERVGAPLER